jgi:PIN domain nuclease of toxin-antitoxin system
MRLLLDTHIFLWWLSDDSRLGPNERIAISDGGNEIFVSAMSFAEIAIKRSLGKLEAPSELFATLAHEGFEELPLLARHAVALESLPWHHRDPFDRMLVAQAITENLTLVTHDDRIVEYGVAVL